MTRRTACLGLSTLSVTAGLTLAASVSAAPLAPSIPLMQAGNHLTLEQLGFNLLTTNRQSLTALSSNPLNEASFRAGAPLAGRPGTPVPAGTLHRALLDPSAREVMKDLVACALGGGQSVSWTPGAGEAWRPTAAESKEAGDTGQLTWPGAGTGLCPAWAGGAPDAACQERVSACLLTRNNAYGRPQQISIRGGFAALATSPEELTKFTDREGAYFGNILSPDGLNPAAEKTSVDQPRPAVDLIYKNAFVCAPPDTRALMAIGCQNMTIRFWMSTRVCAVPDRQGGTHHQGCVASYAGYCGEPAPNATPGEAHHVCAPESSARTYPTCTAGGRPWAHPITVFLPHEKPELHSCRGWMEIQDPLRDHNRPSPDPVPDQRIRARKPGSPDDRASIVRQQPRAPATLPAVRQQPRAPVQR
ncbi:hypothetical protein WMF27_20785 [Sorangium sp. So ce281]|uniref:hypothetical protein n=1 Tax=Sorangium sp. So ce281 TaxID=3133293 RepID=UPI003F643307